MPNKDHLRSLQFLTKLLGRSKFIHLKMQFFQVGTETEILMGGGDKNKTIPVSFQNPSVLTADPNEPHTTVKPKNADKE